MHRLPAENPVITVQGLTKHYGTAESPVVAVAGIDFTVPKGGVTALLGGNGAGKTTTIAMLLGLLKPTSGSISVLGTDMLRDRHRVLPRMNFSSPYVDLPKRLSPRENLDVFARLYEVRDRKHRIAELAVALHLEEFLDRPMQTLSAGQKTRVSLAKALINRPELLLLDEPTASLDLGYQLEVASLLTTLNRERGVTIAISTHDLNLAASICHQLVMVCNGRVVAAGPTAEVLTPRNVHALYGVTADVQLHRDSGHLVVVPVSRSTSP